MRWKDFSSSAARRKTRLSKRELYKNVFIELEYIENALRQDDVSAVAQVHNLVGTCQLKSSGGLNLEVISRFMPNSVYEKQKFAAITIRLGSPQCTMLLFTSGKMVLTGARGASAARARRVRAARRCACCEIFPPVTCALRAAGCKSFMEVLLASANALYMLRTCLPGVRFELCDVAIQNIVGNADLRLQDGEKLDLIAFYRDHNVYCTYQPNMFPGLIYRPVHVDLVILLFFSGRVVLTGARTMKCVYDGWNALFPLIRSYKRAASLAEADAGAAGGTEAAGLAETAGGVGAGAELVCQRL